MSEANAGGNKGVMISKPQLPSQVTGWVIIGLIAIVPVALVLIGALIGPEPADIHWLWWTKGQWELAASAATVIGLFFAVIAGAVAFLSYRAASRAAADAHMHALFRDYLRMRFDCDLGVTRTNRPRQGAAGKSVEGQLAALKLYALEEMWTWVEQRNRSAFHTLKYLPGWRERRDILADWTTTIAIHANLDREEVLKNLLAFMNCYSVPFMEFVADHWRGNREELQKLVQQQREQMEKGGREKPGLAGSIEDLARDWAKRPPSC